MNKTEQQRRRPIMNEQVTMRLTNDLLARVDAIANSEQFPRGCKIRQWVLKSVRAQEKIKQ